VDEDLCSKWEEFLDHLAPYPLDGEDNAAFGLGPGTWAASRKPTATDKRNVEQVWLYPLLFEDWTLETKDNAMEKAARATYESLPDRKACICSYDAIWFSQCTFPLGRSTSNVS